MLLTSVNTLEQFKGVLKEISDDVYSRKCKSLTDATIGQHTRHIIELYMELLSGYGIASVCYDNRKRDLQIERSVDTAISKISIIQLLLAKPNISITMRLNMNETEIALESNYFRELLYNLEHTIHHQALIKVAINQFTDIIVPAEFGVAPSTLKFRNQCAQ